MANTFYVKLTCGTRELNLHDTAVYNLRSDGFDDGGQVVSLTMRLQDANSQAANISKLIHELEWFNRRAIEYSEEHVGQPVWLGIKLDDGNSYDTVFGRGYLWKQLVGRHAEGEYAVKYSGLDLHQISANSRIDEFEITFRCKERKAPQGERIYPWETKEDRWVGLAQGGIRTEDYGGVIIEEAASSIFTNSSFENEADTDLGWTKSASVTATETSDPEWVYSGYFGQVLANSSSTASGTLLQSITAAASNSYRFAAKALDGSAPTSTGIWHIYNNAIISGGSYTAKEDNWYEVAVENFAGTGGAACAGIGIAAGKSYALDFLDFQPLPYLTTSVYGNFGRGFTFSGTAHQSKSLRATGGLSYRNAESTVPYCLPRDKATAKVIAEAPYASTQYANDGYLLYCGSLRLHWDKANNRLEFTDGTNTATSASATFAKSQILYVFAEYGSAGLGVYAYTLSGTTVTSLCSGTASAYAAPAVGTPLYIGSDSTPANQWNGEIQEVQIWAAELTEAERTACVTRGRGHGELPYLWSHTGTGTIYNTDDAVALTHNFVELGNVPGDFDAGTKVHIKNNSAVTPMYIYVGQQRRAIPRTDLPAFRNWVGCHYDPFLEAEAGITSYDSNSATAACTLATSACAVKTAPSTTTNMLRVKIPICNEPEDLWRYHGIWRVIGRFQAPTADKFQVQWQVVTGKNEGPNTPQVYLDADSVWRPSSTKEQIVTIPSYYVDPANLQEFYRPGDWAAATASAFCYLEYNLEADVASGSVWCDGVLLLPQDYEAYGKIASTNSWPQNYYLILDTASHEHRAYFAFDADKERFYDGVDFSGKFHLPVKEACAMVFMHRESGTGNPWVIADQMVISAKYRPRYKGIR